MIDLGLAKSFLDGDGCDQVMVTQRWLRQAVGEIHQGRAAQRRLRKPIPQLDFDPELIVISKPGQIA